MASFSRIIIVMVVVALSLLTSQNGVFGFSLRNRKLRTISQTAHEQQKEASSVVADASEADSPFVAVSSEQVKKERTRLEFLNKEKMNAFISAKESAEQAFSLIENWHQDRLFTDESMWSTLTSDQVKTGFNLEKNTPVVMPQKWQLLKAGINSAVQIPNSFTSDLEVSTLKVNVIERIDAFLKGNICWKGTTQRGIGTIPNVCTDSTHPSMDAGLCYKACNSDEHGVATMCIKNQCNSGYTNFGLTCTYTAGALLKGKGCCCTVFGCCNVNCGYGYQDDGGCICRAITYGIEWDRGVGLIPTGCPTGRTNNAGLCYNQCPPNYVGLATTCWARCGGATPTDCGAACASDTGSCVTGVVDMITGPLTIVLNVVTGGELGAAVKGVGTAAMAAVKDGAKAMISAAAERMAELAAKNLSVDGVKTLITNMGKQAASNLKSAAVDQIFSAAQQVYQGKDINTGIDLDTIANLDPTGIASTVMAFAKPLC